jgi:hypothetical protein
MLEKHSLRAADIVTSVVLFLLSIGAIAGSLQMPIGGTYGGVDNPWYASPAAIPLLVGTLLLVCAIVLFVRAAKQGGIDSLKAITTKIRTSGSATRLALHMSKSWGILLIYAFIVSLHPFGGIVESPLGSVFRTNRVTAFLADPAGFNYVICSGLFLVSFSLLFYRPNNRFPSRKTILALVCGGLLTPFLIGFAFSELLRVPLP